MDQTTETGLVRGIRRWDLVALVINGFIGAGIFGLPSKIYALIGAYSLAACLTCALVVSLIILCFAEVASRFTETGGPYLYVREAFNPLAAFEVGWLLWLARIAGFAAICNLLVTYLSYFWPAASSGWWRTFVIVTVVVLLTIINTVGVREAAVVSTIFTVGKLLPLLLFVIAGLFFIQPQNFSFVTQPSYGSFSNAVLLLVFAFAGFEVSVVPTGEIRDPQRNIPFALLTAMAAVALLYILIQLVCIGTLPNLANSERPLADASSRFLGLAGASFISVAALISLMGILNHQMLTTPRLIFAMAEWRQLPRILSATHSRFRTPYIAILLSATVMLALTLSGTFIYAVTISALIRLLTYGATCAALLILRHRNGRRPVGFRVPAGTAVSGVALALCIWLLSSSSWREARDIVVAAAVGLLIYLACKLMRGASESKLAPEALKDV
jgi:APA family basic amino acid/polyamine antiporter